MPNPTALRRLREKADVTVFFLKLNRHTLAE